MDPTIKLCQNTYSFDGPMEVESIVYPTALPSEGTLPRSEITSSTTYPFYQANDEVKTAYTQVEKLRKDARDLPLDIYGYAEVKTNPFNIGRSIFTLSNSGVKLASIDAMFDLTGIMRTVTAATPYFPSEMEKDGVKITCCVLADGAGGFTKYLQYRRPQNHVFGMTKYYPNDHKSRNWQERELDPHRLKIIKGEGNASGDIFEHYSEILEYAAAVKGADLSLANGGMLSRDSISIYGDSGIDKKELPNLRLITVEIFVCILVLKEHGNMVIRIFDTMTKPMIDLIYLLTLVFREVFLFKPASSRPTHPEKYVICRDRVLDVDIYVSVLKETMETLYKGTIPGSIFTQLPATFINEMNRLNLLFLTSEIHHLTNAITYAKLIKEGMGKIAAEDMSIANNLTMPKYNLDKFLILWSLPSNLILASEPPLPLAKVEASVPQVITGRVIFGIFHAMMEDRVNKENDRKRRDNMTSVVQGYLIDVIYGQKNNLIPRYPNSSWSHTVEGEYYVFTCGPYTQKYYSRRINTLIAKVNGDWQQIYNLVERYLPFPPITLGEPHYRAAGTGVIDGFNSPLTYVISNYCSYYEEDKIFGSLGSFFEVYNSRLKMGTESTYLLYPPMSKFITSKLNTTLTNIPDNTRIIMYLPKWDKNEFIERIVKEWNTTEVKLMVLDHTKLHDRQNRNRERSTPHLFATINMERNKK